MKKNVALVLSSGGARGFAHIGVINTLEQAGFKITSIAGTSMGAVVGGIYATGQLRVFEDFARSLNLKEVWRLTDLAFSKNGLVKGNRIIKKMKEIVPDRNIEDLPIPYCAVATDIVSGTEKVFYSGSLYDAIRASISIPTFFEPFRIGENYYVDGGLLNPVPVHHIQRKDKDLLVIVDVNAIVPYERARISPPIQQEHQHYKYFKLFHSLFSESVPENKADRIGLFALTNKSLGLMVHRISRLTIEGYPYDLLISVSRDMFGTYDFYKASEIIEEGALAAKKALEEYNKENC
ncbi:MAG: patatin-like phospholipase family protein [Bacteroidales bacterium]|nr:patatin-like phospholipase family protein [Lentimicrobiaceae bacterium]MDD5695713.1 patatin-like phospholipase family protein [Bacteroidales bacterium]